MAIIGFIGLGNIGRPMAKNLIKAGYKLVVYDKFAKFDDLVSFGAEGAVSSKDAASKSEIIITMLPNSAQVKEAILGAGGVAEGLKKGSIVVDMSSMSLEDCRELGAAIEARNSSLIDAPVSGGEAEAAEGTFTIIAGGEKAAFEKVKPILSKLGSRVVLAGSLGAGNIVKLVNQIITSLNIASLSEAFVLAAKAGVNPNLLYSAIKDGPAGSKVMDEKLPMILDGNFKCSFKPGFNIELLINDLQNAVHSANDLGVSMPLTTSLMEIVQWLMVDGMASDDQSALVRYYEKHAKVELRK